VTFATSNFLQKELFDRQPHATLINGGGDK
jgi:hypothetical protein